MSRSTFRFYLLIFVELLFSPLLYLYHFGLNFFSSKSYSSNDKKRKPIEQDTIYVNIHEWGGYHGKREKNVSVIKPFTCGLSYQIERFHNEKRELSIDLSVTISDPQLYQDLDSIREDVNQIHEVNNIGMDFSGYSYFFENIKDKKNAYIILTNTSVNAQQELFLKSHINYMENHPEVGMLGVSYCSKVIQTFIRNNFTPHLQSFYILTTIDVLKEVVKINGGFPGENIDHKLLLIRKGEINLSSKVLDLGYKMAIVLEDGNVYSFSKNSYLDNAYNAWELPLGDIRLQNKVPNRINPILQKS